MPIALHGIRQGLETVQNLSMADHVENYIVQNNTDTNMLNVI